MADAYHSLSIEGYRVSADLIERVRSGTWNPDHNEQDRERRNAMAARGYWQAYREVRKSIGRVLKGESPGTVAAADKLRITVPAPDPRPTVRPKAKLCCRQLRRKRLGVQSVEV